MPPSDATSRFSNRVEDYIRHRPGYPATLLPLLETEIGFNPAWLVADIGSGTGILTEMLLEHGNRVIAIEPNDEMRLAAERLIGERSGFTSCAGSAEETGLDNDSIDLVTAAQAFHWFDHDRARRELARVLRPGGFVTLIWNSRRHDTTPFLREYEEFLHRHGTDYASVVHRSITGTDSETIGRFFDGNYRRFEIEGIRQPFDFEGLAGRFFSSSYVPPRDDPRAAELLVELRDLYDRHASTGEVAFEYDTEVYLGTL